VQGKGAAAKRKQRSHLNAAAATAPLGMDGTQVGVLEQSHQVRLCCLLQRQHGAGLEAEVSLEVLCNFAHEALERQLADKQLSRLLVLADLTKRLAQWGRRGGAWVARGESCDIWGVYAITKKHMQRHMWARVSLKGILAG
jgi:hypothetical protein